MKNSQRAECLVEFAFASVLVAVIVILCWPAIAKATNEAIDAIKAAPTMGTYATNWIDGIKTFLSISQ